MGAVWGVNPHPLIYCPFFALGKICTSLCAHCVGVIDSTRLSWNWHIRVLTSSRRKRQSGRSHIFLLVCHWFSTCYLNIGDIFVVLSAEDDRFSSGDSDGWCHYRLENNGRWKTGFSSYQNVHWFCFIRTEAILSFMTYICLIGFHACNFYSQAWHSLSVSF